jgi:hypothetical protein
LKGRLNLLNAQVSCEMCVCLQVSHHKSCSKQAIGHKPHSNISSKAAVVEFESKDSSDDEAEECIAMESFSTNQLSLIGPNSSEEKIHPDNSEGEEDDESD